MTNTKKSTHKPRKRRNIGFKYSPSSYSQNHTVQGAAYSGPAFHSDSINTHSPNYLSFEGPTENQVVDWKPTNTSYGGPYQYPNPNNGCFSLTSVPVGSQEFDAMSRYFQGSLFFGLFRIENRCLEQPFILRLLEFTNRGENPAVVCLFHDTNAKNVNSICQNNFDARLGTRCTFGQGVYFSTRPDEAYRRSSFKTGSARAMFLVDVLVSDSCDTVICHDGNTYIKNDKAEYLPKYVAIY